MKTYTKEVSQHEKILFAIANSFGITPKLISSDGNCIVMELYPYTLFDLSIEERKAWWEKACEKLTQLHQEAGIIWCDIHEENIVIDPQTNDLRLIDFGPSMLFSEFDVEAAMEWYNVYYEDFKDPGNPTINEIMKAEFEELKFCF